MGYRIIADEHIEPPTHQYLRQLGHDAEWIGDVNDLGLSSSDEEILVYSRTENRLVLTQDFDFILTLDPTDSARILFQRDQSLSARQVGDIVDEMSRYIPQSEVTVEYISREWL